MTRDIHSRDFCPRCLLGELPGRQALAEMVQGWIDALPEEQRADEALRRARLEICRRCEYLEDATCALCGCYVDFRTAQADKRCPDGAGRWR